jgi:hypothetical protein
MFADPANLPQNFVEYVRERPAFMIVDVTDAAGSMSGNGHSYFRASPWVSSDVLMNVYVNLAPAERGLVMREDSPVWTSAGLHRAAQIGTDQPRWGVWRGGTISELMEIAAQDKTGRGSRSASDMRRAWFDCMAMQMKREGPRSRTPGTLVRRCPLAGWMVRSRRCQSTGRTAFARPRGGPPFRRLTAYRST